MLAETIEQLRAEALAADDAAGYFAAMYARVTERVEIAANDGRFADRDRMVRFARTFADWYVGPRSGSRPTPACWAAAGDVAADRSLLIVQHLLLGINAHVNHDLPQVVVELAGDEPVTTLRTDFDAINDILGETQGDIVRDLGRVSAMTQWVALRGGGKVFDFSLERARDQAWSTAVRLHATPRHARDDAAAELDRVVSVVAFLVAQRRPPVSWLLAVPRWFERNEPSAVTRKLLGHLA